MSIRIALLQLDVVEPKEQIIQNAVNQIRIAAEHISATVVILPESFNSPYDKDALVESAEEIPAGPTSQALMQAAREYGVYVVGGSIVEKCFGKFYNTCAVWSPHGDLIAKYRKMHLGDSNAYSKPVVNESELFTKGDNFTTFDVDGTKIGLGICWDMRFPEFAAIYRQLDCDVLIYPSLCDVKTGELHWELLARSRALDNQMFVVFCSPARNVNAKLVAYGHSLVVDPWGRTAAIGNVYEEIVVADLELRLLRDIRQQIPVMDKKRTDLYELKNKQ